MATFYKDENGERVKYIRTHHPWLHPTKGWRVMARNTRTNGRRKLIRQGALSVPLSAEYKKVSSWAT